MHSILFKQQRQPTIFSILFFCLLFVVAGCSSDSDSTNTGTGTTGTGTTGNGMDMSGSDTTQALSCSGNRIWGPVNDDEDPTIDLYVTESIGQDLPECAVFFEHDPAVGCSLAGSAEDVDVATVRVQSDGDLVVTETNGDTTILSPTLSGITAQELDDLPDCDTSGSDSGEPLSCQGNRIWGPINDDEDPTIDLYVTESNGQDVTECATFFEHNPAVGCSLIEGAEDAGVATVRVQSDGDLAVSNNDGETIVLSPTLSGITTQELNSLPDCP